MSSLLSITKFSLAYDQMHSDVIEKLKQYNLTNGYAQFWYASVFSVLSYNSITVRAILASPESNAEIYKWFCKNSWYNDYANFVLVGPSEYGGISEENVIRDFGNPANIICTNKFRIYIYDYDISSALKEWWKLERGHNYFDTSKTFFKSNFKQKFGSHYKSTGKGWLLFGPYKKLEAGDYTITYNLDYADEVTNKENIGFCDINSSSGKINPLQYKHDIPGGVKNITFNFMLDEDCDNFEIRVYSKRSGLVVDSIDLIKY